MQPLEGQDGCPNQKGMALHCRDGAVVYFTADECTSARAADVRLDRALDPEHLAAIGWRVVAITRIADFVLIELADAVAVSPADPAAATSDWVCLWASDAKLHAIFGPDEEHVRDYYNLLHRNLDDDRTKNGG
jgi:hypothetical protein